MSLSMGKQKRKIRYVVGIDEVGRGPLAGPVTLAAFVVPYSTRTIIEEGLRHIGVRDSKELRESTREEIVKRVGKLYLSKRGEGETYLFLSSQSAKVIDKKGIQYAIRAALMKLVRKIEERTYTTRDGIFFFLDGSLSLEGLAPHFEALIGGDRENVLIATASIFAKVHRDTLMARYAKQYPHYGFEKHKGYGTAFHRKQIENYGPSPIHRLSWIK